MLVKLRRLVTSILAIRLLEALLARRTILVLVVMTIGLAPLIKVTRSMARLLVVSRAMFSTGLLAIVRTSTVMVVEVGRARRTAREVTLVGPTLLVGHASNRRWTCVVLLALMTLFITK